MRGKRLTNVALPHIFINNRIVPAPNELQQKRYSTVFLTEDLDAKAFDFENASWRERITWVMA